MSNFFSKIGSTISQNLHDAFRSVGSFYDRNKNSTAAILTDVGNDFPAIAPETTLINEGLNTRLALGGNPPANTAQSSQSATAPTLTSSVSESPIFESLPSLPSTVVPEPSMASVLSSDSYLYVIGFTGVLLLLLIAAKR